MKKIIQTIKLKKLKTEVNKKFIEEANEGSYLVWFRDNTCEEVYCKDDLISILSRDHIKPVRYIFNMADRIVVDRDIVINTDKNEVFKMENEDIWAIAKFALNVVSENYKEEPLDCIIDNDEKAIYEILDKYTKDKDEQNKIYGAFLHCQYLDCDKDIYGYVPRVIKRLEKLGYKIIGGVVGGK